jgi:hypothetical protein
LHAVSYCALRFDGNKVADIDILVPFVPSRAAGIEGAVSSCWLRFEATGTAEAVQVDADVLGELPFDAVALVVLLEPTGVIVVVAFDKAVATVVVDAIDMVASVVVGPVVVVAPATVSVQRSSVIDEAA